MSVGPLIGYGTTSVTARDGYSCAIATNAGKNIRQTKIKRNIMNAILFEVFPKRVQVLFFQSDM